MGVYLTVEIGELFVANEQNLIFTSGKYSILFILELIFGMIAPIILFSNRKIRQDRKGSLIASSLVIIGISLNRFNTSWWAMQPAEGYSYIPTLAEVVILAGVLSGVILVFTVVSHYFPIFEETEKRNKTNSN